jgi:hypothetical protein
MILLFFEKEFVPRDWLGNNISCNIHSLRQGLPLRYAQNS